MAVFTTFTPEALTRYLSMFGIGELAGFSAIETGIENSNYFVTLATDDDELEFVLTITEDLGFEDQPFFNELLTRLDRGGLPVPSPVRTLDGMASTIFCGKPAWLFPRLPGSHPETATTAACEQIGQLLARIHEGAAGARYSRDNPYSAAWARDALEQTQALLDAGDAALLARTIEEYAALESREDLPRGVIHGDLFMDNALFVDDTLTGVIDFYHACNDFLVQDLAITINAWARDAAGELNDALVDALLDGYGTTRELEPAERESLPAFLRAGAARFALTRLLSGEDGAHLKDPDEFLQILRTTDQAASAER